jgi:hypothetical protein
MKKVFASVTIFLFLGLHACKKEPGLQAGGNACEDFSLSNNFGTNLQLEADVQHEHPCFNPQNGNEFVYVYTDRTQGISQLRKHDLGTGEWQILVEKPFGTADRILGPPSWGSNGWILYHTLGWDTWKVKDDGSVLERLTFNGNCQFPEWNSEASLFHSRSPDGNYRSLVRNENGIVVDTLLLEYNGQLAGAFIPDWSVDNRLCSFKGYCDNQDGHVVYFNYDTLLTLTHLWSSTNLVCTVKDIEWGNGENPTEIYFSTGEGLYRVDVVADNTCKLLDFCTSIGYETFSISPEGGFMLATRITTRVIDTDAWTIEFDRDIYRIDLATLEEMKVNLP